MEKIELFGIGIHNVTMLEAVNQIRAWVQGQENRLVVTPNVDHLAKLQKDQEFASIYRSADLVLADGMPLVWVSRMVGRPLVARVTGADLFLELCSDASKSGMKVFLLGSAKQETVELAAKTLQDRYPGLTIVGAVSPSFTFNTSEEESMALVEQIRKAGPDLLFVGVGAPKQEKWISRYRSQLGVPVSLGVGAAFDFVAGTVKRAPRWMQKMGLEWFYRFLSEPRRMFRRYFIEDMVFLGLAWTELLRSRKAKGSPVEPKV